MSNTSRRSNSVSSASSSGSSTAPKSTKANASGVKKKFACTHEGCGKSFSRSEHLHRHALNHKDGNNTCLRCSAHFRRRDLLDRHMARHKEKDDEAGGEGLGFLATRKRLWRDADGNIVNCRRPYSAEHQVKRRPAAASSPESGRRRRSSATSTATLIENEVPVVTQLSPLISIPSTASAPGAGFYTHNEQVQDGIGSGHDGILDDGPMVHEAWNVDPMLSTASTALDDFDFLCNSGWGTHPPQNPFETFMGARGLELQPYDDLSVFRPDTASSFNAPSTTMSYYSWLFDKDSDDMTTNESQQLRKSTSVPSSHKNVVSSVGDKNNMPSNLPEKSPHEFREGNLGSIGSDLDSPSAEVPAILATMHMQTEKNGLFNPWAKIPGFHSSHIRQTSKNGYISTIPSSSSAVASTFNKEQFNYGAQSVPITSSFDANKVGSQETYATHVPSDAYSAKEPALLPKITNGARKGLMQLINHARPCKPNGDQITSSDPLLSLGSLQIYSDLFFTRFNLPYPLIHQATFDPENVYPFLLMAILLLGATYGDKESHLLAVCIHDIMRPLIHSSKEFSTKPNLWLLQTILLVECFGKSRAGQKQHDMSHLYHGLLINLIRKSDCQSAYIPPYEAQTHNLENSWREAVIAEQKRRLAMLCFMWDIQHAVLFSQSLCMNASELNLALPWDCAIWEASTAQEWHYHLNQRSIPFPSYLSILKLYTSPMSTRTSANPILTSQLTNLNALSRVLILHGLMSLAWDLHRRDQTSLNLSNVKLCLNHHPTFKKASSKAPAEEGKTVTWQSRLSQSYDAWKTDFETYTTQVLNSLCALHPSLYLRFKRFSFARIAIYHTAQMILSVDIIDLQIFAGAKHITGRVVTARDQEISRRKVQEWLAWEEGRASAKAVWHAARLFRDGLTKLDGWGVDDVFCYPWCLYLATLICWVFREGAVARAEGASESWVKDGGNHGASSDLALRPGLGTNETPNHQSRTTVRETTRTTRRTTTTTTTEETDAEFDTRAEMNVLISNLTKFGPPPPSSSTEHTSINEQEWVNGIWHAAAIYRTCGLVKFMAKQLNTVRWAVVREGMIVLRALVEDGR